MANRELPLIVIADDNPGDRLLAVTAMRKMQMNYPVQELEDGQQLLDFLRHQGRFADEAPAAVARPMVVFLDINMPRMTGLEALSEIKSDIKLKRIPVIMLTTSASESDMLRSYDLGVNSYVTKPVSFPDFLQTMKKLGDYWLGLVSVPQHSPG